MITVVIVDDHSILLSTLKIFLDTQEGISVAGTSNDAMRAVELIKTKTPTLRLQELFAYTACLQTWSASVFLSLEKLFLFLVLNRSRLFLA